MGSDNKKNKKETNNEIAGYCPDYSKYLKYKSKFVDYKRNILSSPISNFKNEMARDAYIDLKKEIGRDADIIVNKPGGIVIYYPKEENDFWVEHILRDEHIAHCVPKKHTDFLYTYIRFYLPPKVVPTIQSISGSVFLDLLKHTVGARCGGTSANYATLRTVIDVSNLVLKGNKVSKSDITKMYVKNIGNMKKDREYNIDLIKEQVRKNNSFFHKEISEPYHPYAFPNGCKSR